MTKILAAAKRIPARPLALGEVTGHHHSIVADCADAVEMYELDGALYVRVLEDAPLHHQEHKPALVPAGTEWGVRIATEVTDWGRQSVLD